MTRSSESGHAKHKSQIQLELEALEKFFRKTGGVKGAWHDDRGWHGLVRAVEQTADMLLLRGALDSQLKLHGVAWERNHVVSIELNANGLRGKLPKQLANLIYLRELKLRNNPGLHGSVPNELYHMSRLRYCYLDGTKLENALPHHVAQSFQITQLHPVSAKSRSSPSAAATISFVTNTGESTTRWIASMTEMELFMVHSSLKARHVVSREPEPEIKRTACNATGPERVAAAVKLQRIYRARIERTKFRSFLKSLFAKQFDEATGHAYYVDQRTGESMWERPGFISKTPREESGTNQEIWQAFDDGAGNTYYWNSISGESTWEPPVFLSKIYQELRTRYGSEKTDDERFELFFRDIDRDQTGSIDRDEFARLCGELGMAMSPKQIANVFDELDTSGDGELSREEIIAWLTRNFN